MAKKQPKTVINNIDSVNIEIDYDKLAEAIVKAQTKLSQKEKRTRKFRSAAMSLFNGAIYAIVYTFAIAMIYVVWRECYANQTVPLIGCILFTLVLAFIGIYAFLCQQESHRDSETDTITHFNTNIALIALIVAMIALFKGVS